ncbi:MAG TPA: altronate dehydratase family protein [Muribaculum sp.]|jgi:altronate hydrolase|uniref:Altronate dehydratase family protein n=1 Tax=Heminiphilus faecis TaxID=2601703 RepID=A0ABV4CXC4_9BACT|nr:altronate dehydratase family protein [Heminiphilus faecis]RLT77825.1 altronate dehydratase [bacterium J10(2018)]DAT44869.1 MAG TPA: D-galactarate dehydratase / Altronate hydrolase [Caudoviricetes sp.]HRF68863.1 altronate dehydratase family protein [Muribaculum sp.]
MKRILKIHDSDNVAVALSDDIGKGDTFDGITLSEDIPQGHKFALKPIGKGEEVIKYGYPIGHATVSIAVGQWVHSHNLVTSLGPDVKYGYHAGTSHRSWKVDGDIPVINGYLRTSGNMGIRNELWIVPTVGCVNGAACAIAERVRKECELVNIDDVRAFTHNYGCSQLGEDHVNTRKALAALAKHPNAGGVLVLGLGCENNGISALRGEMGDFDTSRIRFLNAQDVEDEVSAGFEICKELACVMNGDRRQPLPVSMLKVGLKCGGSDGLSGITANPLVGRFSDRLVEWGGTTVLTEVPEMFGAETILMDRAVDCVVFDRMVNLINGFKDYFRSYGQPIYENPSPGNKTGGITTLEEKSLGCVQKGGSSPVVDVLSYAHAVTKPGLNVIQAPGNDLVASTALALSGCHMVLFTTGRGTPFGTFVPTLKISTNTPLSEHKANWIDFNAGEVVNGESWDSALARLIDKITAVANGAALRHELNGAKDIAIFKSGVTL